MKTIFRKTAFSLILLFLFWGLVFPAFFAFSQEDCKTVKECEALWEELQKEIQKLETQIAKTEQEKITRENQINVLRSRIYQLELQIRQSNVMIKDLNYQIADTEIAIENTNSKIQDFRKRLAEILRTVYEKDQKFLIEILLTEDTLSNFFDDLFALENLNLKTQELLEDIKTLKKELEGQKEKLEEEKEDLAQTIKVRTLQKQESELMKQKQESLLRMTEAQYQAYLREKKELEKRAAEIMQRITQLTLPGLAVPRNPKELYELAKWAGQAAGGVRPALILGLLEVESALGVNVGQCNCASKSVCRHPELSYKKVMSPRQWPAFEKITKELGLDPYTTPVSCYVNGGRVQMGGAMGPAQFMPTTWLNLGYKQRVERITGVKPANPWRARDAFLAAALYFADFGAAKQTTTAEKGAVTAYLCGSPTMTYRCRLAGGLWYTSTVMKKAAQWQQWINQGI